MFPMCRKTPPVTVEYDCRGKRVRKTFDDAYKARQFFSAKDRAGRNPTVTTTRTIPICEVVRGSWIKTSHGWAYARRVVDRSGDGIRATVYYDSFPGDDNSVQHVLFLKRLTPVEVSDSRPE